MTLGFLSSLGAVVAIVLVFKLYWPIILFYGGLFLAYKQTMKLADQSDAERTGKESLRIKFLVYGIFVCLSVSVFGLAVYLDEKYNYSEVALELAIEGNEKMLDKYHQYKSNLTK